MMEGLAGVLVDAEALLGASDPRSLQRPEWLPFAMDVCPFSARRSWCCMQAASPLADPAQRWCSDAELWPLCMAHVKGENISAASRSTRDQSEATKALFIPASHPRPGS